MKPKEFKNKLSLSKSTIANLNNEELKGVQGGGFTTIPGNFATCFLSCVAFCPTYPATFDTACPTEDC